MNGIRVELQLSWSWYTSACHTHESANQTMWHTFISLTVSTSVLHISQTKNGALAASMGFSHLRYYSLKRVCSLYTFEWKTVCSFNSSPETSYGPCETCSLFNQSFFYQPDCITFWSGGHLKSVKHLIWLKACKTFVVFDQNTHPHTHWACWVWCH